MLDDVLLKFGRDGDDVDLAFERHDGDQTSHVICFLPWRTPFALAQRFRLVPSQYLACYVLPNAIVSSEPHLCAAAIRLLVDDALALIGDTGLGSRAVVAGLSTGTAPATRVANLVGCELYSVASGDRGELTIWESPACAKIRAKAEAKGYHLEDFTAALSGLNPIDNLSGISPASRFVISGSDQFVPDARRQRFRQALRRDVPDCEVWEIERGHMLTMVEAMRAFNTQLSKGAAGHRNGREVQQLNRA